MAELLHYNEQRPLTSPLEAEVNSTRREALRSPVVDALAAKLGG
ncbi:MAG TPA: hypothetical protein VF594_10685 [Rubricoccaceae bacterium]